MAPSKSALFRGFALTWEEHLAGEITFSDAAFAEMRHEKLDLPDVVSALETSNASTAAKENPHDAFFSIVGRTCDDELLRLTLSLEPQMRGICVHHVSRI